MESHEQTLLLPDDSHLSYDNNFCNLQSEAQVQFGSGFPVTHEPRAEGSSALQESGMNVVALGGNIVRDDNNSVLENGRQLKESIDSGVGFDKRHMVSFVDSGHTDVAIATDTAIRAGVCIGTIVSVNEQAKSSLAKPLTTETAGAHRVPVPAFSTKPENRIDYGASLAMEDFGGEFEDGHGIEVSSFAAVDVFADSVESKPETTSASPVGMEENFQSVQIHATAEVQDGVVDTGPEEQLDFPESLDKIVRKSPAGEVSVECEEEEPPTLEREVISKTLNSQQNDGEEDVGDAEKMSPKLPSRKSRKHGEGVSGRKHSSDLEDMPGSNLELNVNSRPRRSVNRKSVLELLHVDYRYAGGAKKSATHRASDSEVNHEPPAKKQKSPKKGIKVSTEHQVDNTERAMKTKRLLPAKHGHIREIDDQINELKKKVVGYKPDDFLDDGVEPEDTKTTEDKEQKSTLDAEKSLLKESIFSETDELAARSFLSAFAAESAEALSSSKQEGDLISQLDALTAENHELRSRIKSLEQSRHLTKKFNIDFHGRKFSRMRSPAVASPDQQKTPGRIVGGVHDRTPATERKAPLETGESMLSRIAVLDRREHKLRELSAELDERTTSVKIAEGALRRRERKLLDFEKTLEHRERVLSRHEQSLLKRELVLGSPALPVADPSTEDGEDRQSLAAEIQRRLEQRRLELDRRQAAMDSERTRLEIRERELDQHAANSRMAKESLSTAYDDGGGSAHTADSNRNRPSKRLTSTSTGNQKKTAVSRSIRSKYLSPKKQKVAAAASVSSPRKNVATTPSSSKKGYILRSIKT